jgi:hypothetical protein
MEYRPSDNWRKVALHCFDPSRKKNERLQKVLELVAPWICEDEGLTGVDPDPVNALNLRACAYWEEKIGFPFVGVRVAAFLRPLYASRFELKPEIPGLLERLRQLPNGDEICGLETIGPRAATDLAGSLPGVWFLGENRKKPYRLSFSFAEYEPSRDERLTEHLTGLVKDHVRQEVPPAISEAFAKVLVCLINEICWVDVSVGQYIPFHEIWMAGNLVLGLKEGKIAVVLAADAD